MFREFYHYLTLGQRNRRRFAKCVEWLDAIDLEAAKMHEIQSLAATRPIPVQHLLKTLITVGSDHLTESNYSPRYWRTLGSIASDHKMREQILAIWNIEERNTVGSEQNVDLIA